ncbi:MAG: protein-methionine-sulfoxide reductase catalytic subunit MsrP [Proteobacteria bacterium]|nr:protein-methionine-sulfoxide reductase catalytic subunit MsrP [Pseudomonadota bacterium]MDE3208001.1 protein-methionine-sulfoxide reductase catalytic subunit MsrP [Pseudomonadota bacterium]
MIIRNKEDIPSSEITEEKVYLDRRAFFKKAASLGLIVPGMAAKLVQASGIFGLFPPLKPAAMPHDPLTSFHDITHYNNFYEFGTNKSDPSKYSGALSTNPWQVKIDGLVRRPGVYSVNDLIHKYPQQDRVYRLRCVEAWSMVIPWSGFPLGSLLKQADPLGHAHFVEFWTLYDPKQMPGQRVPVLDWPYREGLRLDEAMHPLTILATGLYGKPLPNQDGAPIRLVVPWKYGFKSIKSIVRIRLVEHMPQTSWQMAAPDEYGFYSNVNPKVNHPRWSQATERRIGEWGLRRTLLFNGYANQVGSLYSGMNLRKNF